MELIGELFIAIFAFLLEIVLYTIRFLYKILKFIFIKKFRKEFKLEIKKEWETSYLKKIMLIYSFLFITVVFCFGLYIIFNFIYYGYFKI